MDFMLELLKIVLPAVIVFFTAFYLIKFFLKNETDKKYIENKALVNKETILLRLQAYERLVLFLERMSPSAMVMRMNKNNLSAADFHLQLLSTVRSEFEHNLAQQLYISNESWQMLVNAKEEVIKQLNLAKEKMSDTETAVVLTKTIIANSNSVRSLLVATIAMLKKEAAQLF
ncbi:MAG: hypothetical protein HOD63_12985 [Bacteroidetes bacterium]|jgi:arsenate reductase-like glutaredoxin family protein|nr:hypothetical protein [Bacteroidota bacterium]MBT5531054.1 hypothetical protein [Cytophagia bacterium]MBT3802660.1 hypothetical protein [Bacteroidota bacterium]MBT3933116.1 hypothetical protein [Bacteroidota bacterium]MBT4339502.1 hypothetical protein [Bacteroidota bacterium]